VDDVLEVDGVQGQADLRTYLDGLIRRQLVFFQPVGERAVFNVFHGHVQHAIDFTDIDDRDDVFMLQLGEHPAFGKKPLFEFLAFGRQPLVKDLDGDLAVKQNLDTEINFGHAAGTDFFNQFVAGNLDINGHS